MGSVVTKKGQELIERAAAKAEADRLGSGVFELVGIDQLAESKINPRRVYDNGAMADLAESIIRQGVLQPILVRFVVDGAGAVVPKAREIVAGHRRFRAAKAAGLKEIPAIVRMMSDAEVAEVQLIENIQRQDLAPMEEAEGLLKLVKSHRYTPEQLADRIGRSRAYVYGRLKLTELPAEGKAALREGRMLPSVALLIARIADKAMQEKAVETFGNPVRNGEPIGYSEASRRIRDDYMLVLTNAPFDQEDAALVPEAGACGACPKRTGNQAALFPDTGRADVCTDAGCFRAKSDAAWARTKAAEEAAGREVIEGKEARELFPNEWSDSPRDDRYVKADERCWDDEKGRTYGRIVGKAVRPVICRKPDGTTVELLRRSELKDVLKQKGVKPTRATMSPRDRQKIREAKIRVRTAAIAMRDIGQKGLECKIDTRFWHLLAKEMGPNLWHDAAKLVVARWFPPENGEKLHRDPRGRLTAKIDELAKESNAEGLLRKLVVEIAFQRAACHVGASYGTGGYGEFADVCRDWGVDLKAIEKTVRDQMAEKKGKRGKTRAAAAKAGGGEQ